MDYMTLAAHCSPNIDAALMVRLVKRESAFNQYALGLDGRYSLKPQPRSYEEAVQTAERLIRDGVSFSAGPAQLHITNIRRYGLTWRQVFHPCTNLLYAQSVFLDFHRQALAAGLKGDDATFAALRGYNSGNIYASVSNGYASAIQGRTPASPVPRPAQSATSASPTSRRPGESLDFFEE